jgi:bacillithiol system protein YtxJ
MDWLSLTAEDQLEQINEKSFDDSIKGVLLFKHSTRCSISSMALNRLERNWDLSAIELPAYHLDLLKHHSLSSKIAAMYHIKHESPQVLIIKNGKCIYSASHSDIHVADIKDLSL